ncbi:MAG: nicotinate phosphoribosyltransferase [Bryobacteraceae bacterium]|nr:nicotinate phosphoribosyltransferase [Bryobacteraceae bacterium]
MNALLTDLYQLTMAAGYFEAGRSGDRAAFELFARKLPPNRDFLIAAGLHSAADYLLNLRFEPEHVDYLRGLPQFSQASPAFFEMLRNFRFTGDVDAVPEGALLFPPEPFLFVQAPIVEAQLVETVLLACIGFESMIASKAARIVEAARDRPVVEFGTRRAHGPEAGTLAARAAYIGGCIGTSNTLTGFRYGIPVYGTAAHSWVMSFPRERMAYERLQSLLGAGTVYLVDTYDTLEGVRLAASLGRPLWGIRLDSGDLGALAAESRRILDAAGLPDARIFATGDLNEVKIAGLAAAGAPIDVFGVGTELATSFDAPALGVIYKMVEAEYHGELRYTVKLSEGKKTYPGRKQVFRFADRDVIGRAAELPEGAPEALLQPVIRGGKLVRPLPGAAEARDRCAASRKEVSRQRPVEYSKSLRQLSADVERSLA